MQEKLNYKYTLCSEPTLTQFAALCTSALVSNASSNETKKLKNITKLKAASHSEMQNVMRSIYTDGFTVNTTTQDICNCQNKNEKMTATITTEHDKF